MVGLPCSGKTTRAKELERELGALRLTGDHWHLRLFGDDLGEDYDTHNKRHQAIESIIWGVAARALELGVDVIHDFGCWAREERDAYKAKARALGADCVVHYMDTPQDELFRRLAARNGSDETAFHIPVETMREYCGHFQHPAADELEGGLTAAHPRLREGD
jgi:predicted kinase